jgi:hypothetical protein
MLVHEQSLHLEVVSEKITTYNPPCGPVFIFSLLSQFALDVESHTQHTYEKITLAHGQSGGGKKVDIVC